MTHEELLAQPFMSVPALVGIHAQERPAACALRQDDRVLSYAALDDLASRIAATLQAGGLRPGDSVAVCARNSIEYAAVYVGGLRTGGVVAPLAPSSTPEAIAGMVADAGARVLFVDAEMAAALAPVRERLQAELVALDAAPAVRPLTDWLLPEGAQPQPVVIQPEWPFNIIYSSGTTGTPKGIVQPHGMRWGHVRRGAGNEFGPEAVSLISTPLYSNTTLVTFFQTLGLGGTVVLMAKFDARRYLELAERHRVTHTMLVPVQYQRLMAFSEFDSYDLSSFRYKFCTSAPFPAALKADILARWPGGLIEVYGMTEGGGACILAAHEHPDKLHTVGQPAPGHDIRVIDDAGNELPRGQIGEVVGSSPAIMIGYHNQPEKTAEAEWHDAEGRRFIRTGDIGRFDDEGFLILLDRKKDVVISGGFNIFPSDIEHVLREHPAVADAAVVGVASERWGETPVAFVTPAAAAEITEQDLLSWANERLGKTQRLADVVFKAELPRSAIGKVLKRELRDLYSGRSASTV